MISTIDIPVNKTYNKRIHTTNEEMKVNLNKLIALGGKEWIKGDHHRVYFNDPCALIGLDVERYGSGSIKNATLKGEKISNNKAHKLIDRIYFDVKSNKFVGSKYILELIEI